MATGDHFLFVHADTHLPQDYDLMASECLRIPGNVAGAFKFGLDIFHETDRYIFILSLFNLEPA